MRILFNKNQFISHFARKRDHRRSRVFLVLGWILNQKTTQNTEKNDITSYITASILKHYANGINFNMLLTYGDILVCDAIIHDKIAFDNTRNTIKNGELFAC